MSNVTVPEAGLPVELDINEAVQAAYPEELRECAKAIRQHLPLLIEADKELTQYLYVALRPHVRQNDLDLVLLDGRAPQDEEAQGMGMMQPAGMGAIIAQLRDAVRGSVEERVLALPHLDLLTTSSGGLTSEAREVIQLLYENPQILFLGFADPSFELPKVIENLFPRRVAFLGLRRDRIQHLVTQQESRKFATDDGFSPFEMYKYVSGLNAVRLRRLLPTVETEDYPVSTRKAFDHLRQATLSGEMTIPNVDLDKDIGGYGEVKRKLREEILDMVKRKDGLATVEDVARIEKLIPRGMIFWGPPGTGKTLFSKALATALGATTIIVSGPELKSKWVGEGEKKIRNIFRRARQSAPSIIVFDELDSIASSRTAGATGGDKADNSMVNQLLTEMDGFRSEELVFVVGTTNFVESLDQALLRPGRFEFHLEIDYPDSEGREAILNIYNEKMDLRMTADAMGYAVRMSSGVTPDTGMHYSGDHLEALCRQIARDRLRNDTLDEPTTRSDIDAAIDKRTERPKLTPHERSVVATHEAGHAVVSMHCENAPPIERVSLRSPYGAALGEVRYSDHQHKHVQTEDDLRDRICVFFGGMEAERMLVGSPSIGAHQDVNHATHIAEGMATHLGVGNDENSVPRSYKDSDRILASSTSIRIDKAIDAILVSARDRARAILVENQAQLEALRDMLLEHETVESTRLNALSEKK